MLPSAKNKSTPDSPPVCLMVLPKSELLDKPLGWAPTLIGYSAQGLGKFSFYEIFKDFYKNIVG
jgi:hypothetical protein